jgi:molybdopterin-guanine dinucleotide biosynthesis protein A
MGRPKAWLPVGQELMLARMTRIVRQVVVPVVVVAAPGQELPRPGDAVEVVRDREKGRGPLQGISAGLEALQGRADAAFVCSCDLPFLRPTLIEQLIRLLGEATACVPFVQGRWHPLAAVYRLEVKETVDRLLGESRLRMTDLIACVPARKVEESELREFDPELESLRNVNTPEEYEAALRGLKAPAGTPAPANQSPTTNSN